MLLAAVLCILLSSCAGSVIGTAVDTTIEVANVFGIIVDTTIGVAKVPFKAVASVVGLVTPDEQPVTDPP